MLLADEVVLQRITKVFEQVPPICYLFGSRCSSSRAFGIDPSSVSTDNFHTRMLLQPPGKGSNGAFGQDCHRTPLLQIAQDRAVPDTAAPGKIIDT
jgi:hypothetical protein